MCSSVGLKILKFSSNQLFHHISSQSPIKCFSKMILINPFHSVLYCFSLFLLHHHLPHLLFTPYKLAQFCESLRALRILSWRSERSKWFSWQYENVICPILPYWYLHNRAKAMVIKLLVPWHQSSGHKMHYQSLYSSLPCTLREREEKKASFTEETEECPYWSTNIINLIIS